MPSHPRRGLIRRQDHDEILLDGEVSKAELRKALTRESRHHTARFADFASLDGDIQSLSLDEFRGFARMMGCPMRDALNAFKDADLTGDGSLDVVEFFSWSLSHAYAKYGFQALNAAFCKYDSDSTGSLDAHEFDKLCSDMGFGAASEKIFESIDRDGNNSVSYKEILATLRAKESLQKWNFASVQEPYLAIDVSGWALKGSEADVVQAELRALLVDSGAMVADLVKIFDQDAGTELAIDPQEFYDALRKRFAFKGPKHVIDQIFDRLDSDGGGRIGFDEFFEYVRGFRHALDQRFKSPFSMRFRLPKEASHVKLYDVDWDVETIRGLMVRMTQECKIDAHFLMRAWDKNDEKSLDRVEFADHMKLCFIIDDDSEWDFLWEHELLPTVQAAFLECKACSKHVSGRVDAEAIERWLDKPSERPESMLVRMKSKPKMAVRDRIRRGSTELLNAPARVDLIARTKQGIKDAKEAAKNRPAASKTEQDLLPRWKRPHGGLPPLQRWEEDTLITSVRSRMYIRSKPSNASPRVSGTVDSTSPISDPHGGDANLASDSTSDLINNLQHQSDEISPRSRLPKKTRVPFPRPLRTRTKMEDVLGDSRVKFQRLEQSYAELCAWREDPSLIPVASTTTQDYVAHITQECKPQTSPKSPRRKLHALASQLCREYNSLGMECLERDPTWAASILQRALSAAPQKDPSALVHTLSNLGVCWMRLGSTNSAVRYLRQAAHLAAAAEVRIPGSPRSAPRQRTLPTALRIRVLLNLCAVLNQLGQHREALRQAEAAVKLVSSGEITTALIASQSFRQRPQVGAGAVAGQSMAAVADGRHRDEHVDEEVEYADVEGAPIDMSDSDRQVHRAMALHNCGVCHEHLGQLSHARLAADEALAAAKSVLLDGDSLLRRLEDVVASLCRHDNDKS